MALEYPQINGSRHSWASITIDLNGDKFEGIKEIKYSDSLEPGEVMGTSTRRIGRTRGEAKAEASITLYLSERKAFLAKLGPGGYKKAFQIVCSYEEAGEIITDTIVGCRVKKVEGGGSSGADAMESAIELDVHKILWNGVDMIEGDE